jgi:peptidyl-dipeptidase A
MRTFVAVLTLCAATAGAQSRGQADSEAERFLTRAERVLDSLAIRASRAQWVQQNFITDDTEILNAEASTELSIAVQRLATEAKKYDKATLPAATKRRLTLLKLALAAPPPADPKKAAELSTLVASLDAAYGKGQYCRPGVDGAKETCLAQQDISRILATSRVNSELVDVWKGWHTISIPMRDKYTRFVELSNEGAKGLGFADAGAMWRSGYDMAPDEFAKQMEGAWNQLKPLYVALHAYVRSKLFEKYGASVMKADGPIPTQLLGNIWAQEWGTIYDVVAPAGGTSSVDITGVAQGEEGRRERHGALRGKLLHVVRLCQIA